MIALLAALIDVAPEPVRGAVAGGASYYVGGLALAAAIAFAGVILIRRRKG
jgi:hypothetical protein